MAATSGGILISYRRADASGQAGRIYDRLAKEYGPGRVFMDVDGIEPGADFVQRLDEALGSCKMVLPIIGPHWAGEEADGTRRIDEPGDFVRIEVAEALKRSIKIIPLLVQGTPMPPAESLPADLQPLPRRQAIPLDHARWEADIQRLLVEIDKLPGFERVSARRWWRGRSGIAVAAGVVALAAVAAVVLLSHGGGDGRPLTKLVYRDTLTNPSSGWTKENQGTVCHFRYAPDGYHVIVTGQLYYCAGELGTAAMPTLASERIAVDLSWPSPSEKSYKTFGPGAAGLSCYSVGEPVHGNGYVAFLSPSGYYNLSRYDDGNLKALSVGHNGPVSQPGQVRHLQFECVEQAGGVGLTFIVDGVTLTSAAEAKPLAPGAVSMQAGSYLPGSIDAVFRNLRVYR